MFNYFVFDGHDSRDYGVYISGGGTYNSPARRYENISVPGRDGDLLGSSTRLQNVTLTYPAGVVSDFAANIEGLRNMLLSTVGYAVLYDSYHPDEYRFAVFKGGLEQDPLSDLSAGEFEITFECKPQRYLFSGGEAEEVGTWEDVQTETGDIVTFTGDEDTAIKSLAVQIDPVQDLHGYDNPWPAGGGKNKYEAKNVGGTSSSVTFALQSDGKIKLTGTADGTAFLYGKVYTNMLTKVPAGSYILSGAISSNIRITATSYTPGDQPTDLATKIADLVTDTGSGATFTLAEDAYIAVNIRVQSGQATNVDVGIQIETGSTASSWVPYSNICPISGHTGANVTIYGDDAAADAVFSQGSIKGTDGTDITANNRCRTSAFSVSGNVIVECPSGFEFTTRIYATDNTYIADESDTAAWIATDKAYQITGDRLMRLVVRKANDANITPSNVPTFYVYQNYSKHSLSWNDTAGTVYAGTLEAQKGLLSSRPQYASYNGETLTGPWISSMDEYAEGTTPTTGAQVVDLGGTVAEYEITGANVSALEGVNNIFADVGPVTVEYGEFYSKLVNPTLFDSRPVFRVVGYGTLTIGTQVVTIAQNSLDYIDIDSAQMDCYCGATNANQYVAFSTNDFPVLPPGETYIDYTGNISSILVTTNWWRV